MNDNQTKRLALGALAAGVLLLVVWSWPARPPESAVTSAGDRAAAAGPAMPRAGQAKARAGGALDSAAPVAPAMPTQKATGDAPAAKADEYAFSFATAADLERYRIAAEARGAVTLAVIPGLNILRLRLPAGWRPVDLPGAGTILQWEPNYLVHSPELPPPPGVSPEASTPFGTHALAWLGAGQRRADWGAGVTVAVLDTGIVDHPALAQVHITHLDLVQGGAEPVAGDLSGHGTAVATLLAGAAPAGVRGVAPGVNLLDVRVLDGSGQGDVFTLALGIVTAVDSGAAVISISLGMDGDSFVLQQAVDYAVANNVLVVAAAGNGGTAQVSAPAAYTNVLAVTAVDANGTHLNYANYGPEVGVSAPGAGVVAGWTDGQDVSFSGTSAAVPFVSGAVAGLLSDAATLTPAQAGDLVRAYADDLGYPGTDPVYGSGSLDVGRLLNRDVAGLQDAAVSDIVVDNALATATLVPLLVGVQNRGTVELANPLLAVTTNGVTTQYQLGNLGTGQTGSVRIYVDRAAFAGGQPVSLVAAVSIPGGNDVRPANNSQTSTLTLQVAP